MQHSCQKYCCFQIQSVVLNYFLRKNPHYLAFLFVQFSFLFLCVKMLIVFVILVVSLSSLLKLLFIPDMYSLLPEYLSASDSKWSLFLETLQIIMTVEYSWNNRVPILKTHHEILILVSYISKNLLFRIWVCRSPYILIKSNNWVRSSIL